MDTDRPSRFSAPLANATHGLFEVMSGASNLTLHALAPGGYRGGELLAEGHFTGRPPEVRIDEHRVRLFYSRGFRDFWRDWRAVTGDVGLSPLVPWDVIVRGGVSRMEADLEAVQLGSLEIVGGVSEARVRLPRPRGTVRVFVLGGVSELRLSRPADVPLAVSIHGGASGLQVDSLRLGAVGGRFSWETPGFAEATARYIVEIHGGVSEARIGSDEADEAPSREPRPTSPGASAAPRGAGATFDSAAAALLAAAL